MRVLIIAALLAFAAPAQAADTVIRTVPDLVSLEVFRDRVVWVETDETVWTLEGDVAIKLEVAPVHGMDVGPGPDGKPVAILERCARSRRACTYTRYDFATRTERAIEGTPTGPVGNFAYWRDRFAFVQKGRLNVTPLKGKSRDIGRAWRLRNLDFDFNGSAVLYVRQIFGDDDRIEFRVSYWPTTGPGSGRYLMTMAHGASGELSLTAPHLTATEAYVTQTAGEFGGPYRLWRIRVRDGARRYAGLPAGTLDAVPLGTDRSVALVCPDQEDRDAPCRLVLRQVTYRAP